ncbi:MAG TPA: hypothetical protein VFX50_19225, partial [Gemmatimonadales bacterium]|nr:hypothetical protein [Gemmatimonadales bacterium]
MDAIRLTLARRLAGAALCLAGLAAPALAQDTPPAEQNLYRAGPTVRLDGPVRGDLLAAGGRVLVEHPVSRDAAVAGGDVAVRADIGEDLRAVGGQVEIDARVGGDAHVAGGHVALGRQSAIVGGAWLAGGSLELAGRLPARTRVHAGQVTLSGEVDGDLFV